jgi:CRP/FNR family transcriptional regulator, cyclic AMP receptor protein
MGEMTDRLRQVPLFSRVNPKDLEHFAAQLQERRFPEGDTIISEGGGGVGFFLIEQGNATVSVGGDIVRTLGPGDYFGEVALIDNGTRSATIVATTDLVCQGMTVWEFRPIVQSNPDVAWSMLETMAARLREAESRD